MNTLWKVFAGALYFIAAAILVAIAVAVFSLSYVFTIVFGIIALIAMVAVGIAEWFKNRGS